MLVGGVPVDEAAPEALGEVGQGGDALCFEGGERGRHGFVAVEVDGEEVEQSGDGGAHGCGQFWEEHRGDDPVELFG